MAKRKTNLRLASGVATSVLFVSFSSFVLTSCFNNTQKTEEEEFNQFQVVNKLKRLTKENQKEKANFEFTQKNLSTVETKKENLDSNFLDRLRFLSKSLAKGEESFQRLQLESKKLEKNSLQNSSNQSVTPAYKTFAEGVRKHQKLLEKQALVQSQFLQAKKLQRLLSETKKHFFKLKALFEELEKVYSQLAKGESLVDLALNNLLAAKKNNWSLWTETFLYVLTFKWLWGAWVGYHPSTTFWVQEKDLAEETSRVLELRKETSLKLETLSKQLKLELAVLKSRLPILREQALTFKDVFRLGLGFDLILELFQQLEAAQKFYSDSRREFEELVQSGILREREIVSYLDNWV